jgi:YVTN family beta-propeller protein
VIDTVTNTVSATIPAGLSNSCCGGAAVTPDGSKVYVVNSDSKTVSVIDTATNTVVGSPIPVQPDPRGIAVAPDGSKLYVGDEIAFFGGTVSVIDTVTNTVSATIPIGDPPLGGVAVTPDGSKVYVPQVTTVAVIDTVTNTVIATIPVGLIPIGVAVSPDGSKVYVTSIEANTVSVIDTVTNTVSATIPIPPLNPVIGATPASVVVTPDGSKVYVVNANANNVSVIDAATNTVIGSPIPVGIFPHAFGVFIQPAPRFAGTPGSKNYRGTSVSALAKKFGGIDAAAAALGFPNVQGLQDAIEAFCEG